MIIKVGSFNAEFSLTGVHIINTGEIRFSIRVVKHTLTLPSVFIAQIISSPLIWDVIYIKLIFKCANGVAQCMYCLHSIRPWVAIAKRISYWILLGLTQPTFNLDARVKTSATKEIIEKPERVLCWVSRMLVKIFSSKIMLFELAILVF